MVTAEPRTREDFIGYVMMKSLIMSSFAWICGEWRNMFRLGLRWGSPGLFRRHRQSETTIIDVRHGVLLKSWDEPKIKAQSLS